MTENALHSLSFFKLLCSIIFTFSSIFSFDLNIKFRKTKQKVITLVAATLKTLLAVAKANGRFSRRKLNASNVYDLSLSVLIHMLPHYQKRCATEVTHRKTQTPIVVTQTNRNRNISAIPKLEEPVFLPSP